MTDSYNRKGNEEVSEWQKTSSHCKPKEKGSDELTDKFANTRWRNFKKTGTFGSIFT